MACISMVFVEHTNEPIVLSCFTSHWYGLYMVSQKKSFLEITRMLLYLRDFK